MASERVREARQVIVLVGEVGVRLVGQELRAGDRRDPLGDPVPVEFRVVLSVANLGEEGVDRLDGGRPELGCNIGGIGTVWESGEARGLGLGLGHGEGLRARRIALLVNKLVHDDGECKDRELYCSPAIGQVRPSTSASSSASLRACRRAAFVAWRFSFARSLA